MSLEESALEQAPSQNPCPIHTHTLPGLCRWCCWKVCWRDPWQSSMAQALIHKYRTQDIADTIAILWRGHETRTGYPWLAAPSGVRPTQEGREISDVMFFGSLAAEKERSSRGHARDWIEDPFQKLINMSLNIWKVKGQWLPETQN